MRKPNEGVWNVVSFNWHFYVLALAIVILLCLLSYFFGKPFSYFGYAVSAVIGMLVLTSLIVTHYIYDLSELYKLRWLNTLNISPNKIIATVNAGFDETSLLISKQLKPAKMYMLDFYDEQSHTEISIKRAQNRYPPHRDTLKILTQKLPEHIEKVDLVLGMLSIHEIRNHQERIVFFKELSRILNDDGKVIVVEHLRDIANFAAYHVGFFHFLSENTWMKTFAGADLCVTQKLKITPFITVFILEKNAKTY